MSTIIKKDRLADEAATPQPIVYQFVDVSDQAHNYLTQIKAKAVSIVDQAQQDAEDIRKQAVYEGQQAADQLAERKAEQGLQSHLSTLLPALQEVEQQLRTVRDQWLKHWECQVVHLATTIAERIIRREVSLQPEITVDLVKEALEVATGRQQIKVRKLIVSIRITSLLTRTSRSVVVASTQNLELLTSNFLLNFHESKKNFPPESHVS